MNLLITYLTWPILRILFRNFSLKILKVIIKHIVYFYVNNRFVWLIKRCGYYSVEYIMTAGGDANRTSEVRKQLLMALSCTQTDTIAFKAVTSVAEYLRIFEEKNLLRKHARALILFVGTTMIGKVKWP